MNPVTKAYRRVEKIPRRRRLLFSLSVLFLVAMLFSYQVVNIRTHCYAVTYSLGNGYGFIYYTPLYNNLPPILQESVRDHENHHLQVGSYAFWRHNQLEIDAYNYQIEQIDLKLMTLKALGKHLEYHLLKDFRRDMVALRRAYEGYKDPDDGE